eukprot:11274883-Heterocapsa_arctica.AAC.1
MVIARMPEDRSKTIKNRQKHGPLIHYRATGQTARDSEEKRRGVRFRRQRTEAAQTAKLISA